MKRNFEDWFGNFKDSISTFRYYVDFDKIYELAEEHKVEINILNSLIGSKLIEKDFINLVLKYPDTLEVVPLLLAIRSNEIYIKEGKYERLFRFDKMTYAMEEYIEFMRETGLFNLLQNHIINNLYDYILGVEVGLDSHARKSRGGDLMENLVEGYIEKAGYKKSETYFKEMYLADIEKNGI